MVRFIALKNYTATMILVPNFYSTLSRTYNGRTDTNGYKRG